MKKPKSASIHWMVLLLTVSTGSALGFLLRVGVTETANARSVLQSDEKVIRISQKPEDPLRFEDVLHLKKVRMPNGGMFNAKSVLARSGGRIEDWLEDLEFTARNDADKTITYVALEVQLPDTSDTGPMMAFSPIARGIPPKATGDLSRYGEPLSLRPGSRLTIKLSSEELNQIKRFLTMRRYTLPDINRVWIQVMYLIFDDGIKWSLGGTYYRPNPNAPTGYERIEK